MAHLYPWTAVRIPGGSRDTKLTRRRRLWAWRDGADPELAPTDGAGRLLAPEDLDWSGCDRPPGRPAEAGSRAGAPILVRVSADERATLEAAAERAGEPLSTWLRDAGLRGARR